MPFLTRVPENFKLPWRQTTDHAEFCQCRHSQSSLRIPPKIPKLGKVVKRQLRTVFHRGALLDRLPQRESDRQVNSSRPYSLQPWHLPAIVLLAWALHLPTLRMGFFADDYGQQVALRGLAPEAPMKPWSLYDFGTSPPPGKVVYQSGAYPWWTPARWKARFFRPLSSMSLWLDHVIYGGWATGYHLTSLAILGVLVVLLFSLFRSAGLGDHTSIIALLIFVCGDSALLPVGWPANRNTLLECTFLVASLLLTIRAAQSGRNGLLPFAIALGICALFSKESGIGAMVLIPAFLYWFHDRPAGHAPSRITKLTALGCFFVIAAYLTAYVVAGLGTTTAFYPMPWTEPMAFGRRLLVLIALAPFSFLGVAPIDAFSLAPHLATPTGLVCAVPAVLLCTAVWRRVRLAPTSLLWVLWIVVTILPQGTPPASDRLLFVPAVGAAALLGILLTSPATERFTLYLRRAVVVGALIVSPITLMLSGALLSRVARHGRAALVKLDLPDASVGSRELFFLQGPNDLVTAMAYSTLAIERHESNFRAWPIQLGGRAIRWTRVDERTFDFETLDEPFFTNLIEVVFLDTTDAPRVGTVWHTALFTVEALDSHDNALRRIRVRLNEPPDDARYRFFAVDSNMRFQPVSPPAVAASIDLPRVPPALPWLDLLHD